MGIEEILNPDTWLTTTGGPRYVQLRRRLESAITDGRLSSGRRRELAEDVDALARGFGYRNRLFHAEVAFRERSRLSSLPPFIFTYELAENGRTMVGAGCLTEVRRVLAAPIPSGNVEESSA